MTADSKHLPKYLRVAAAVKAQIADGTLRPGQPAPSGAALSRETGYSTLTCRKALRVLVNEGVLLPGPSRNARPRVAGSPPGPAERDLAAAARALSAGLATRRRAHGLTQPKLAELLDVSVTTIGHAETGRLWQARHFWVHADAALDADGELLRLHEAFGEASASTAADAPDSPDAPDAGESAKAAETAGPAAGPGAGEPATPAANGGPGIAAGAVVGPVRVAPIVSPAGQALACVMIMWADGTVTTVRPPETSPPETVPPG
jgi:DNA-binding GntR family transcriptional regulator